MDTVKLICSWCNNSYDLPVFRYEYNKRRGCKNPVCSKDCRTKQIAYTNLKKGFTKSCGHLRITIGINKGRYIHRVIMENYLGRKLNNKEIVHHLNGNPEDNRIENLALCKDVAEHMKYHTAKGKQGFQRV